MLNVVDEETNFGTTGVLHAESLAAEWAALRTSLIDVYL